MKRKEKKIPVYYGFRIYFVAIFLYYMLISPISSMIYITNFTKLPEYDILLNKIKKAKKDSLNLNNIETQINQDSILSDTTKQFTSENNIWGKGFIKIDKDKYKAKNYSIIELLFIKYFGLSLIFAFLYFIPFKVFLNKKRKNKVIRTGLNSYCKKLILHTPLISGAIMAIGFIAVEIQQINDLFFINHFENSFKRGLYFQYWIVFSLAAFLTISFVYNWQKHRLHTKYLTHFFDKNELTKRLPYLPGSKIKYRLLFSSFLTSIMPIAIFMSYLLLSISSIKELNLYYPGSDALKIIFGNYVPLIPDIKLTELLNYYNLYYINVPNTILLFLGIGMGIFVSVIYMIFFVYWFNSDIVLPVRELLHNMQTTASGKLDNYSVVRIDNEIGELAENYNIMSDKLNGYFTEIKQMNEELENKVAERTSHIQMQKEEIVAQRDEVESQRDEIEQQRDNLMDQKELILTQKRALTDSIEYAGNIQQALLPLKSYMDNILKEYFVILKPKDIVSGDFYWFHDISKGNTGKEFIIIAADCTGHGVPGALLSMLGTAFLNEIIIETGLTEPADILNSLKKLILKSIHQEIEKRATQDGIDISVCKVNYNKMQLSYAGAYNPVYILRKESMNQTAFDLSHNQDVLRKNAWSLFELKADRIPIGNARISEGSFTQTNIKIIEGDIIYLFSDGFMDQFGGDKKLKFMSRRFKDLLCDIADEKLNKQKKLMEEALNNWKGDLNQIDDILVMGLKI